MTELKLKVSKSQDSTGTLSLLKRLGTLHCVEAATAAELPTLLKIVIINWLIS